MAEEPGEATLFTDPALTWDTWVFSLKVQKKDLQS